ncbi:unnamed protein product [Rotaria magnacalcarata]|uniref:Uncharacterized protein n=3 Tax=Rotaria magnacalcarata TaxID=392030 RepID=A0A816YEK3_9BILA|nr:unnamed protein product [Rotaria magnacalcarata]
MAKRLYRDQHIILRTVYHRFKLHQIKNILRNRDVRYIHLKLHKSSQVLSIRMKRSSLIDLYFDRLPGDLFDKEHYQQHQVLKKRFLAQEINEWEEDSLQKIKQTAQECRQVLIEYENNQLIAVETQLAQLTEQLKAMRKENEFNEIDLDRLKAKFTVLTQQFI